MDVGLDLLEVSKIIIINSYMEHTNIPWTASKVELKSMSLSWDSVWISAAQSAVTQNRQNKFTTFNKFSCQLCMVMTENVSTNLVIIGFYPALVYIPDSTLCGMSWNW